jgi:hypothetical protein
VELYVECTQKTAKTMALLTVTDIVIDDVTTAHDGGTIVDEQSKMFDHVKSRRKHLLSLTKESASWKLK